MAGNFSSQNYDKGMQRLPAVAESEEEEESEEDNNTELLIETMAREHAAKKMSYCGSQSGKISCENVFEDLDVEEMTESPSNEISIHKGAWGMITPVPPSPLFVCHDVNTYGNAFPPLSDYVVWPSLPHIVPLEEGFMEGCENCSVYTVESPSGSPIHDSMSQDEDVPRRQKQKLEKVGDVAANRMRKRNLEGLLKEEEKVKLQAGVKRLTHAAAALADRSLPRGRPLLGDRDGIQIG
ncbi:uncharacterized protein [Triticum aestivum]|uniref:uncharacterized protein n=1 Tax=Triticum aestivum TaxID=4565 RepID=UPI001D02A996|nr:uncharacterized protein LOC123183243 [Triticum aestivum]